MNIFNFIFILPSTNLLIASRFKTSKQGQSATGLGVPPPELIEAQESSCRVHQSCRQNI